MSFRRFRLLLITNWIFKVTMNWNRSLKRKNSSLSNSRNKIIITGFENGCPIEEIRKILTDVGKVKTLKICEKTPARIVVSFYNSKAADEAIKRLNGNTLLGTKISVSRFREAKKVSKKRRKKDQCQKRCVCSRCGHGTVLIRKKRRGFLGLFSTQFRLNLILFASIIVLMWLLSMAYEFVASNLEIQHLSHS